MTYPLDRDDVRLAQLADELAAVLARPVALSARFPGQLDADGNPIPGVLVLRDPTTGAEIDADAGVVADAVAAHVPTVPRLVELQAKGWANLTAAERDEALRLTFEAMSA